MNATTFEDLMALSIKPISNFFRRLAIAYQLRSIRIDLDYIARTRIEHREEERIKHKQQALLLSELAALER